jgi:hypothetical protein
VHADRSACVHSGVYFGILVEVAAESEMADAGRASRGHRDHH